MDRRMKLLVADDSKVYRQMLRMLLEQWGYEVLLAEDGAEARDILQADNAPRLAILDCVMPKLSGPEVCQIIRQGRQNYIYIVLLSANGEQKDVMKGFELGADDFLCKPFEELELQARLKVGERIIQAQQELIEAREALKFEATHDAMLRLWNRGAIIELLEKELQRSHRSHECISVCLADIDFFKRVNDTYGHLAGDEVLRRVAGRMIETLRGYDMVGRYGGEEFLMVLPGCTEQQAGIVVERVRQSICQSPVLTEPKQVEVSASFGVCEWLPGQELADLLHQADLALYRAKNGGRNRVELGTGGTIAKAPLVYPSHTTA
jgi:diguanylate cyclase (GGDEF)-like protein